MYSCCALDVGYDNPYFVTLETNYGDADSDPTGEAARETEKELVYFELDLGLNHVARKWAEVVDRSANILFQVPGAPAGPGGEDGTGGPELLDPVRPVALRADQPVGL